jgi:hypothetical protein
VAEDDDLHVPSAADRLSAWTRPRDYALTRTLILRLLGFVYVFAFLGIIFQGLPLLGSHGLTPAASFLHKMGDPSFIDLPTVFVWDCSDTALMTWAYVGLAISLSVAAGYANLPMLLVLWLVYGSYERIGQTWWGFGWEIQLLETTLIAAFLAHPWDPRPLAARPPPTAAIVLARWLVFRIMLGAGLIKLRGDACWRDLTCLHSHFETQPIPNPMSAWFHHMPHVFHSTGVLFNHFVEVVCPFFVFGPRKLRIIAGVSMLAFQGVLILSGNLAFLNWLTVIPVIACFDDDALLAVVPRRFRDRLRARLPARVERNPWQLWLTIALALAAILFFEGWFVVGAVTLVGPALFLAITDWRKWLWPRLGRADARQITLGCFCALVIFKSGRVVDNLTSLHHQDMNAAYDRLALVNTYGAFGSVGSERYELLIEGTLDADPEHADWRAYELPCKPGDLSRRPCFLGPYHRRLDWLIWFAAMEPCEWQIVPNNGEQVLACFFTDEDGHRRAYRPRDPWWFHMVYKLLDGDRTIRELIAVDPFAGKPPRWLRIRRARYHFASGSNDAWWTRDEPTVWLAPIALDTPGFSEALGFYGWPSPSVK